MVANANIFYEDDFVTLAFEPAVPCVHEIFHGFVEGQQFRDITNKIIAYIKENHQKYTHIHFLADCRKVGVVRREDTSWAAEEADPLLYQYGCRKIAFIMPENLFAQRALNHYKSQATPKNIIESRIFDNPESARTWLTQPVGQPTQ